MGGRELQVLGQSPGLSCSEKLNIVGHKFGGRRRLNRKAQIRQHQPIHRQSSLSGNGPEPLFIQ